MKKRIAAQKKASRARLVAADPTGSKARNSAQRRKYRMEHPEKVEKELEAKKVLRVKAKAKKLAIKKKKERLKVRRYVYVHIIRA